jgi:hypothetical protein
MKRQLFHAIIAALLACSINYAAYSTEETNVVGETSAAKLPIQKYTKDIKSADQLATGFTEHLPHQTYDFLELVVEERKEVGSAGLASYVALQTATEKTVSYPVSWVGLKPKYQQNATKFIYKHIRRPPLKYTSVGAVAGSGFLIALCDYLLESGCEPEKPQRSRSRKGPNGKFSKEGRDWSDIFLKILGVAISGLIGMLLYHHGKEENILK